MSHKPPKDLATPTPGQPHRAGDSERIGTSRIGYLAPLPLPTGMPAVDHANAIGEMNDVWLDYGAGLSNVSGWQTAILGPMVVIVTSLVILPLLLISIMEWEGYRLLLGAAFFGGGALTLIVWAAMRYGRQQMQRAIPIRFHRQRREVCFTVKGRIRDTHEAVIVPWESLMAWVVEGRGATQYGTTRQYGLGIGYAHPQTGEWLKLEFMAPGLPLAIGEWEALRAYMEYEVNSPDEIQDPLGLRAPGDPPYEGAHTIRNAHRKLYERLRETPSLWGYLYLPLWYGFHALTLWTLPGYLAERETRIVQQGRPHVSLAKVEAWSQPLPREQWAKPSEELVRLSAEVRRIRQRDPQRHADEIFAEAYRRQGMTV